MYRFFWGTLYFISEVKPDPLHSLVCKLLLIMFIMFWPFDGECENDYEVSKTVGEHISTGGKSVSCCWRSESMCGHIRSRSIFGVKF